MTDPIRPMSHMDWTARAREIIDDETDCTDEAYMLRDLWSLIEQRDATIRGLLDGSVAGELESALVDICVRIEEWENAVRAVVGRDIEHGMDISRARAIIGRIARGVK
jgi:hypothetical protein